MSIGKIWYREATSSYCVKVDGKIKTLCRKSEGEAKAELERARLIIKANTEDATGRDANEGKPCRELIAVYLEHGTKKFSSSHQRGIHYHCRLFLERYGDRPTKELKPILISDLLDAFPKWKNNSKSRHIITIKAVFNRLVEREYISKNPFQKVKKPRAEYRGKDGLMSDETYQTLLTHASPWLRDVVVVLRQTGVRPGTLIRIEAHEIYFASKMWITTKHKTFHKTGKPISVYMQPAVSEICFRLAALHSEGNLFRNAHGKPLTTMAIYQGMRQIADKHCIKGVFPYQLRHTLGHQALMEWELLPWHECCSLNP